MLETVLAAMSSRGADLSDRLRTDAIALGVNRFGWEASAGFAGAAAVVMYRDIAVAADASLYYRADLRRALGQAGHPCSSEEPSDLIHAAYEAFGADCVRHLEGDFAFIVHDGRTGRVLLARDHVGRRPLHYVVRDGLLAVSSTSRALFALRELRLQWHLPTVAAAVAGLLGGSMESGIADVLPVPAGTALSWTPGGVPRKMAEWQAPEFRIGGRANLEEGSRELRDLLVRAVEERMAPVTAVWLSGGADSTAVFGATQLARARPSAHNHSVVPVTVSYPLGDSAREDHHVEAIARQWNTAVNWIDSEPVRILDEMHANAAVRDDPYAHTFEQMNRTLARTSVAAGARVVFDGYGGDQLFHVSEVYVADLFARLRWVWLYRELEKTGDLSFRPFLRHCLVPWLPHAVLSGIQRRRGRDPDSLLAQSLPAWLTPAWKTGEVLRARAALEPPRRWLESPAGYESRWYTRTPYFPRAVSWSGAVALEAGVEARSPLMDRRIILFAAGRPLAERVAPGESKLVLREAVRSLIPDSVLAPRPQKTGIPRAYLHRRLRDELPGRVAGVFTGDRSLLQEIGVIDLTKYRHHLERYLTTGDHITGVQLLLTLQCEVWLRTLQDAE